MKENILQDIISIVRESSLILKQNYDVTIKGGFANIVTSADVSIQNFLYEKLSKLVPGSGFICEEENVYDPGHEYEWIIDPIDGTTNFVRQLRESSICVALAHNGEVIMGVVYNPFKEMMFSAELGKGSFLNGEPIHVSDRVYENSLYFTALCLYRKQYAPLCMNVLKEVYQDVCDFRRFASCALEICYLAMGCGELLFEIRLLPWDFAAAALILREAGGCCCSLHGGKLQYETPTPFIGANSKENLEKLSAIVSKNIPEVPYKNFE